MKHLLMDPAFPDLVGAWAADQAAADLDRAIDNADDELLDELSDPLLAILAKMEIAATRLW